MKSDPRLVYDSEYVMWVVDVDGRRQDPVNQSAAAERVRHLLCNESGHSHITVRKVTVRDTRTIVDWPQ